MPKLTAFKLPGGGGGSIFNLAALWQYALGFVFLLVAWNIATVILQTVRGVAPGQVAGLLAGVAPRPVGQKPAAQPAGPPQVLYGVRGTLR